MHGKKCSGSWGLALLVSLVTPLAMAHEHGIAEFKLNREDQEWQAQLHLTNPDLFGFEYCAPDKSTRRHYQKVRELLSVPSKMFELSPRTCTLRNYKIESPLTEAQCAVKEGTHNDAHISFVVRCGPGVDLKSIDMRFLKQFGDVKEVKVSISTPTYSQNGNANAQDSEIEIP